MLDPSCFIGYSIDQGNVDAEIPKECDMIGIGPIFPTKTKKDAAPPMGLELLKKVVRRSPVPAVAIGGITMENVDAVMSTGVVGVAVIGALMDAENPEQAAKEMKARLVSRYIYHW